MQTAAKLLQIATLLLLTAYRNLPTPYPTVPSPTLYDVPVSHNANITDRRQTDGQTDRTLYHKRDRTTQYGRLKNWKGGRTDGHVNKRFVKQETPTMARRPTDRSTRVLERT